MNQSTTNNKNAPSILTKEQFISTTIEQISQVYHGKRNSCRCGCRGEYVATTYMANPRTKINNSLIEKRLNRAKRLVERGANVDLGKNYVDVETGNDISLTFYFDELKK